MRSHLLPTLALAAAVAAPASAHAQPRQSGSAQARVYVATLKPVRADIRNYSAMRANATLRTRARGRRARIAIRARALAPRRTHPWAITTRRCAGRRLAGWRYTRLRSNRRGVARATGTARRFRLPRRPRRYVVVYQPGTRTPLLCGRVRAKRA